MCELSLFPLHRINKSSVVLPPRRDSSPVHPRSNTQHPIQCGGHTSPTSAAEHLTTHGVRIYFPIVLVREHLIMLFPNPCLCRHQMHFDSEDEGETTGGVRHPIVSTVLYLTATPVRSGCLCQRRFRVYSCGVRIFTADQLIFSMMATLSDAVACACCWACALVVCQRSLHAISPDFLLLVTDEPHWHRSLTSSTRICWHVVAGARWSDLGYRSVAGIQKLG
jgi:hypothetical protein